MSNTVKFDSMTDTAMIDTSIHAEQQLHAHTKSMTTIRAVHTDSVDTDREPMGYYSADTDTDTTIIIASGFEIRYHALDDIPVCLCARTGAKATKAAADMQQRSDRHVDMPNRQPGMIIGHGLLQPSSRIPRGQRDNGGRYIQGGVRDVFIHMVQFHSTRERTLRL